MTNVRTELEAIYKANGRLTSALLVEAASPEDHPLHDRFLWDDAEAGHQYRLVQAGHIIRSVVVKSVDPVGQAFESRAFIAVDYRSQDGYRPAKEVFSDPRLAALALRQVEMDIADYTRKYGDMQKLAEVLTRALARLEVKATTQEAGKQVRRKLKAS